MQLFARCNGSTLVLEATGRTTMMQLKQQVCNRGFAVDDPSQLVLYCHGKVLRDSCTVGRARLATGSTLDVQHRLLGGGGDGGATGAESRASYLEMYAGKKVAKVDPNEERLAKYTTCHLSGERLSPPCCCDELGNLFNKDALVRALLSKSLPKALAHITGLKAVTNVILERNSSSSDGGRPGEGAQSRGVEHAKSQGQFQPANDAEFCCPITGVPLNGRYRFLAVRQTGHVISEKALKEVPVAVRDHVGCDPKEQGLILLNPEGEELDRVKQQVLLKLAAAKAKKAAKRTATAATEDADGQHGSTDGGEGAAAQGQGALSCAAEAGPVVGPGAAKKAKGLVYPNESAVFQSLFLDPSKKQQETFLCRANGARGMRMA